MHRRNEELAAASSQELPIPEHNIALGYGSVSRVLRAHGYDYIGGVIDECIALASKLEKGRIAMSRTFADQFEGYVGSQEFRASTTNTKDPALGRLRLLEWP